MGIMKFALALMGVVAAGDVADGADCTKADDCKETASCCLNSVVTTAGTAAAATNKCAAKTGEKDESASTANVKTVAKCKKAADSASMVGLSVAAAIALASQM